MTNEQLKSHIRRLQHEVRKAQAVMKTRNTKNGINTAYECEVCGHRDKAPYPVMKHVEEAHGYPEEDAGLATHCIYV